MNMKIDEMFQNIGSLEDKLHKISGASEAMEAVSRVRRTALELRDEMIVPATEKRRRQLRLFELMNMASDAIDDVFLQGIDSTSARDLVETLYELVPELEEHIDSITPRAIEADPAVAGKISIIQEEAA